MDMRAEINKTGTSGDEMCHSEKLDEQRLGGDAGVKPDVPAKTVDPAEIAKHVYAILNPILRVILKNARLAALGKVHTVDLTQACTIIKVSPHPLRWGQYISDLAEHEFDPEKLNGVLEGRLWRFELSEVHRFATWYWSRKRKRIIDGQGPAIRGRDA